MLRLQIRNYGKVWKSNCLLCCSKNLMRCVHSLLHLNVMNASTSMQLACDWIHNIAEMQITCYDFQRYIQGSMSTFYKLGVCTEISHASCFATHVRTFILLGCQHQTSECWRPIIEFLIEATPRCRDQGKQVSPVHLLIIHACGKQHMKFLVLCHRCMHACIRGIKPTTCYAK